MRRIVRAILFLCSLSLYVNSLNAEDSADLIQFEADNYSTNLETHKTEVSGKVHLRLGDRELFAEKLVVDPLSGDVEATGHILYRQGSLEIESKGVKFNLKTGLGIFYNAAVRKPGAFQLEGKEIKRVSQNVYQADVAKVSFCQDCPQSWSLVGDRLKVNTERYIELHHAVMQIRDVPVMYLPFIYYPAQDKRFSGLLIPYFKFSTALGAQIGIPFYYAPTDNLDFTLDYRYMSRGGHRNDLQTKYVYSDYSFLQTDTSWIRAPAESLWQQDRYGIHYGSRFQFFDNWAVIGRGDYISDLDMSFNFEDDSAESDLPNLSQDINVETQYENFAAVAGVSIPQNNLERDDRKLSDVRWTLPQVKLGVPLTPILPDILGAVRVEELSVRRYEDGPGSAVMGRNPDNGFIVSGDRYTGLADISVPLNFDFLRFTSKAHYRGDYYHFGPDVEDKTASRSRFSFEEGIEGDIWRVWEMGWKDMPRMKHVVTPFVNYFYSPREIRSNHEFFSDYPLGAYPATAPRFDLYDGGLPTEDVRLGTEEEERLLRDHSLITYGFKTQFLGKFEDNKEIREILFFSINHEYDLLAQQTGKFRMLAQGHYRDITLSSQLAWSPRLGELDALSDLTIDRKYFAVSLYQTVSPSADNVGGEVRLKRLGPFELATAENFDQQEGRLLEQKHFVSYASSSKCWKIDLGLRRKLGDNDFEYSPSIQLTYSESIKNRDELLKY